MFARVATAKGSSQNKTAEGLRKTARVEQPDYSHRPESAETGIFDPRGFSWHIGNIAVHAPLERDQSSSERGGLASTQPSASLPWPVQAKLEIGAVDDPLEREADRVAEQVTHMPDAGAFASRAVRSGGQLAVRRECSCGGSCSQCGTQHDADDEHGEVQRKAAPTISSIGSPSADSHRIAPRIVHEALRSSGEPLRPATRAFFEPKLAHDLSTIRVHADERAAESAHAINARAYTVGRDLVFGRRQYQPETLDGRRLLAHELTHSIQQSAGLASSASRSRVMRAPPAPVAAPKTPHPTVMVDIRDKFGQFYEKLSPEARYRLNRNVTIAMGVVTEKSDEEANSPMWVYTLSSDASNKEIDAVAQELGLVRLKPRARAEGRGSVGAPNDAEQLLTEGAEAHEYDVWAVGVNRKVCVDCELHMKDAGVLVEAFPDGAFRKGGSLYQYKPSSGGAKEEPAEPPSGSSGGKLKGATAEDTTAAPAPPKSPSSNKPPAGTGAVQSEPEGGETIAAPKAAGAGPQPRVSSQIAIHVATGVASLGLGWIAAYLKAKVDQKIAQQQIDAFLAAATKRINENPDEAVKKMMMAPDQTVYAWVNLESSVVTFVDFSSGEPTTSDSSPMIDLSRIDYELMPVDQSMMNSFPKITGGGHHITVTHTIIIDIPLQTPPIEELFAYAKSRHLPLDYLLIYVMKKLDLSIADVNTALKSNPDPQESLKAMEYWGDLMKRIDQALPEHSTH